MNRILDVAKDYVKILKCSFTVKFIVSRRAFCKLRRDFGFFFSVNHLSGGGATQITANLSTENPKKLYIRRSSSTSLDFLLKDFLSRLASVRNW